MMSQLIPIGEPFDFGKLKARWAREREAMREESERMRALVQSVAVPILKDYGATAVYLFGSVAQDRATPRSDLDLLALGIGPADYWDLRRALEQSLGRPLDLFTQDDDPVFVAKIIARGQCLYGPQS